jgi:tetratricopeptide (TPR) repeat protein
MAAHLTDQERNAAIDLAALGEIFSREAAAMTIADADDTIEALMFKGVLTTSVTLSPPLFGHPDTRPPLAFTHSLIHRQLVPRSRSAACRVVSLLAAQLPLYSAVPFSMLADCQETFTAPADEVIAAIENALSAAERLETTPDWQPGTVIWKGAWELLQRLKPELPPEDQLLLEAQAIHVRLFFLKRDIAGEEHGEMARRLFELTADPATAAIANYHLHALHHAVWKIARDTPDELSGQLRKAEAIFERFPELSESPAYIHLLQDIANVAATVGNYEAGREIDSKLTEIMASEELPEEIRELAFRKISINLLWLFETPDELARRLSALEQLERVDPGNIGTMIWKITIFEQLGRFDEAVRLAEAAAPHFRSNGQTHFQLLGKLVPICSNGGFGDSLTAIEQESCRLLEKASPTVAARLQRNIGVRLSNIALLLGDPQSSRRITADYLHGEHPWALHPLAAHIADRDLQAAVGMIAELPDVFPPSIDAVGRMVASDTPRTRLAALAELRELFASPPLRINNVLIHLVVFDLIALLEREPAYAPFVGEVAHQLSAAINDVLDWFGRHELWAYMSALLDRHGNRLKEEEREDWRGRTITIAIRRESTHTVATHQPMKISMLGSIQILMQNGETVRLRTGRLRTLLGLLVADCMVEGRLSQREFWEIVAGSEGSPERARKGTNLAVHRLREAIGHGAILTGHDTPRLNLELVEADLLEANAQLRECEEALNDDYLIRAYPALLKALEITRGEVPFPGLYEEFFEAAREDFDYRLRRAVIETSGRLLHEGETEIAETILRRGFESLPGDDEIAELLQATLVRTGRHVEASRVRMKAVEAEAG